MSKRKKRKCDQNIIKGRWLSGKESACQCRRHRRCNLDLWVGKIPWKKKWQPTPVFLPGESLRQRCLVGYSPWSHKESDMTERLSTHTRRVGSKLTAGETSSFPQASSSGSPRQKLTFGLRGKGAGLISER